METKSKTKHIDDTSVEDFIMKASTCLYNHLWKCKHDKNKSKKCTHVCENYKHGLDYEDLHKTN